MHVFFFFFSQANNDDQLNEYKAQIKMWVMSAAYSFVHSENYVRQKNENTIRLLVHHGEKVLKKGFTYLF